MTLPSTGSFLLALSRPERVGRLTERVKNLPVSEFVCLLDFITAEFQQSLNAFDLVNNAALESILEQILEAIAFKVGQILHAERATIFLLDRDRGQLWAKPEGPNGRELRIPLNSGITGRAAALGETLNVDLSQDASGFEAAFDIGVEASNTLNARHLLCVPIRSSSGEVVAVVQLLNKRHTPPATPDPPPTEPPASPPPRTGPRPSPSVAEPGSDLRLASKIASRIATPPITLGKSEPSDPAPEAPKEPATDPFSAEDEARFREFAAAIGVILESCQSFYTAARNQRAVTALLEVMTSFARITDLDHALDAVMAQARELLQAEEVSLFLVEEQTGRLQRRSGGKHHQRQDFARDRGIVGQVAATGQPINISNVADDPHFDPEVDAPPDCQVHTLLCMPLFDATGKLIGASQAVNRQQGSFSSADEAFLRAFNTQAGIALENTRLFESVSLERQYQKDILRSLSNGVISTDQAGQIVTINAAALTFLGCPPEPADQARWEAALRQRPVGEVVPAEGLDLRLADSLKLGTQHYVPDQAMTIARAQQHNQWVLVGEQRGQVYRWNDRRQPLIPAPPLEHLERVANLSVVPLTNPEGKVRGGLVVLEDVSREKRMKSALYRYMNPAVADLALDVDRAKFETGERREVTILFSDIRGYTTLSERLDAAEVVALLNRYFETMVEAVFGWGGTLDKFIGDALMAVFGAPLPLPDDHGWTGVRSALEMRDRLAQFNQALAAEGATQLRVGIGLSSGEVIVGNIGSQRRMDYTAIGDPVNVSSRLESLTKQYGCDIIISELTYARCRDKVWVRELDRVRVKGKRQPLSVYELISDRTTPLSDEWRAFLSPYQRGMAAYHRFQFQQAMVYFAAAQQVRPGDLSVKLHLDRSMQYLDCPPPEFWDGSFAAPEGDELA